MQETSANNKRIAKNTLLLYLRMLILMVISLYTSRVILNALGVEDYGIYNVVGGVVTMFSLLSTSLSSSISRFLTFELGRGNLEKLKSTFSTSIIIQSILALIIILLAETVGLWFVNTKLVIPTERMLAANYAYQFSILAFAINLINIPYNALIIAHERMSAFAYISIAEGVIKLTLALLIIGSTFDRLIFFSAGMAILSLILFLLYWLYCKRHFEECSFTLIYNHNLLKDMFGFAGWNFIGAASGILRDQGANILINMFCGPSVNTARALSLKVSATIGGFVQNFMTALNPQITKSYANDEKEYMTLLLVQGSRLSYYMLLILSLPIFLNTNWLLLLWLGKVPEHTAAFVQLMLLFNMMEAISYPLITAMLATGKIRNYQIVVGGLQFINLPLIYAFLYSGCSPESVIVVAIFLGQICFFARLYMLKKMIGLPVRRFVKDVYLNVIIVSLISALLPIYLKFILDESFLTFILTSVLSFLCSALSILYVGCTNRERNLIYSKALNYLQKIK